MDLTTRTTLRRAVVTAAALVGGAGLALGGGAASASTPPGDDSYCAAHLATEAVLAAEDSAQIGAAMAALQEAAPPELADAVQTVINNADGPPTDPVFAEAYGQLVGTCGFAAVDVRATQYSFGGIPEEPSPR